MNLFDRTLEEIDNIENVHLAEFDDYPLPENLYETKNVLQELAKPCSQILSKLEDTSTIRLAHLIKLFYYKNQPYYKENFTGWVASARKSFDAIPKTKETNKYPSFEKLYEAVWLYIEDSFEDFHKSVIRDLNVKYKDFQKITEIKFDEVKNFCQKYNKWACRLLSKTGIVSYEDTSEKIKELLNI